MELGGFAGRGGAGGPGVQCSVRGFWRCPGRAEPCGGARGRAAGRPGRSEPGGSGAVRAVAGLSAGRCRTCEGPLCRPLPSVGLRPSLCASPALRVGIHPAVLGAGWVPSLCVWVWGPGSLLSQPCRGVMLQEEVLERQRRARSGVGSHGVASHPHHPSSFSFASFLFLLLPFFFMPLCSTSADMQLGRAPSQPLLPAQ